MDRSLFIGITGSGKDDWVLNFFHFSLTGFEFFTPE